MHISRRNFIKKMSSVTLGVLSMRALIEESI